MSRLKFLARVNPPRPDDPPADGEPVSFLPMPAVSEDGRLDLSATTPYGRTGYTVFQDGDVLVAKITPCFENGKGAVCAGLTAGVGYGSTEFHVLRPSPRIDAQFLYLLTWSDEFRTAGRGLMEGTGGQKRVPVEFVKDFRVALPPLPEQRAIAARIAAATADLDAAVDRTDRELALLAEYRARLVADVVTGALDVRGHPDAAVVDAAPAVR